MVTISSEARTSPHAVEDLKYNWVEQKTSSEVKLPQSSFIFNRSRLHDWFQLSETHKIDKRLHHANSYFNNVHEQNNFRDLQKMQVEKDNISTGMAKQFVYLMDGGISWMEELVPVKKQVYDTI